MTVEIRTLRVSAQLDNAGYVAPGREMETINKGLATSAKEAAAGVKAVGDAAAVSNTKVGQAGDGFERFKRANVTGYAALMDFEKGLRVAGAGLDKGRLSAEQAADAIENLSRKYGQIANASEIAERGQLGLSQAVSQANSRMAAQVTTAEQAALAQRRMAVANENNVRGRQGNGASNGRLQNLGYQGFDIGQGLAQGMPIGMIAAQQLPQIAQLYAGQGGLKAALSDVATLATGAAAAIGPIGIALGVTGAAAFAYYQLTKTETKTTDELLEGQTKIIDRMAAAYGGVTEQAAKAGVESRRLLDALGKRGGAALQVGITAEAQSFFENPDVGGRTRAGFVATTPAFQADLAKLRNDAKTGKVGFEEFYASIAAKVALDPSLAEAGNKVISESEKFATATETLREYNRVRDALFNNQGANGRLLSHGTTNREDAGSSALYEAQQRIAAQRSQQSFHAQISGLNARSPQERSAVARQSAAAQYNNDETPAARQMRIEQAGTLALAQAEKTLNEAREVRARNLDKIVGDQQLEISLIGKTAGEASGLRREYELINQLKEEARQNGVSVDQKEIDRIKETTTELSKMADALARAKMGDDLKFERAQLGRSDIDQQIASRQRGAGLPVDLSSGEADQMRELERVKELRAQGKGFVTDLVSGLRGGEKIGEAFGTSILNGFARAGEKQVDKLVDIFMSWAFPTSGGSSAASAGPGIAGSILGAANDNKVTGMAPVIPVTRAPLGAIGGTGATQAWNFWKSKGLEDHQVAGVLGNIQAESAFNPGAIGDGGAAKGLFQWNDRAPKMVSAVGSNWRNNPLAQHEFAYSELMGSEGKAWNALKGSTDVRGATAAFAGFERPQGFSWSNPENAHNFTGRLDAAEKSLDKFGGSVTQAAQATTGLGQTLASIPQAMMANGGGAGMLSGLTKYGMGLFSGSAQFSSAWMKGGIGLYADGTDSAPGGLAMVGERGRELVNLPRGSQVVPNHKTEAMLSRAANGNGENSQPSKVDLHVTVIGGSGDDHVKNLARQGAQQVLGEYNESQRRGGFGQMNSRFASQRG